MKRKDRLHRFFADVLEHTPIIKMLLLLVGLWLPFAAGLYLAERHAPGATIDSYAKALYWGVAAFSTGGIAHTAESGWGMLIGGVWIVIGSAMFFGTIVATITTYFMRPLQRPHRRIIDTIEYNLEQLDQLSLEELDLLRNTVDSLIEHMEGAQARMAVAEGEEVEQQHASRGE